MAGDEAAPGSLEQGMAVLKAPNESWFTELSSLWPGTGLSIKVDEVLFRGRSDFQVGRPTGYSKLARFGGLRAVVAGRETRQGHAAARWYAQGYAQRLAADC